MVDIIKNNFLGISSKDKLKIFKCFYDYLNYSNSKKTLSEFDSYFGTYISDLEEYVEFSESYMNNNSIVNRYIRGMILEYLYKRIESHHVNYNQEHVKGRFTYYSEEFIYEAKIREYKRYFEPVKVDSSVVDNFISFFDDMKSTDKSAFIEEFCFLYSRIHEFSFLIPNEEVEDFSTILRTFLGDDVVAYYNRLYPTEKMMFIKTLSSSFCCLDKKNVVNNENPNYVRELRKKLDNKAESVFN